MEGRGSAIILAFELEPRKFNFSIKILPKNLFYKIFYACHFGKENWREPPVSYLMNDF